MGIEWSLFASKQLDDVLDYVEDNFGSHAAQKTLKDIDKRTDWLTRYPEASTIDYDLSDDDFTIRHTLVLPNVMYYVIKDDCIIIAAVMHSKQSPQTIKRAVKKALEQYR